MNFDADYYVNEIRGAEDYPHFQARAKWILTQISSGQKVYILGCGFGWTVKHLRELGVEAYGIESSTYAYSQRVSEYVLFSSAETYEYPDDCAVFSWNMLDCLDYSEAYDLSLALKDIDVQQHITCCSGDYDGYFIQPKSYWDSMFEGVIDYEDRTTTLGIPLSWGREA